MATIRQIRHDRLLNKGFLPFEAWQYSKTPFSYTDKNNPKKPRIHGTLALMARTRYKEWTEAGQPSITSKKWVSRIKYEYDARGWEWNPIGVWRQYRLFESVWIASWEKGHPGKKAPKPPSPTKSQQRKAYRALNREQINEGKAKYRASHKKKIKAYAKEYRLTKRELSHPLSDKI